MIAIGKRPDRSENESAEHQPRAALAPDQVPGQALRDAPLST